MNNVILKERGGVKKKFVPLLLAGQFAEREHLLSPNSDEDYRAVTDLQSSLNDRPRKRLGYRTPREILTAVCAKQRVAFATKRAISSPAVVQTTAPHCR